MIPHLSTPHALESLYLEFLETLPAAGFAGDIHTDYATRLVTATDNSVYQRLPQAVIYPRHADDVIAVLRAASEPRFRAIALTPRGGGTGTNGQSLSDGVIVDVSRHMNRILEIDAEAGWARVEPGVVLDQLNDHVRDRGVFFAPHVSPTSRATIGGMISTDASGKGSRVYGKTSEHVRALTVVLDGGVKWTSRPLDADALAQTLARDDVVGRACREIERVCRQRRDLIRETFPKLRRFLTGYNLAMVRDEDAGIFDANYLLAGSEGTLGFVVEAEVRLVPIPTATELVVLQYAEFDDALAAAQVIAESEPGAIETIDETVLGLARQDAIIHRVGDFIGGPDTGAINLVEYIGDDPEAVRAKVTALIDAVESGAGYYVARNASERAALWDLRKKGVGLLGNAPGPRKPSAFVEDTVVPPQHLPEYVRRFRAILDGAGVRYGMFGHVDVGCLHVRPAVDMKEAADERLLRRISDSVCDLVQEYGGLLWGEHGKGYRSEYSPRFFGETLYGELCHIKAAFDPYNQFNPGKIATPPDGDHSLVSIDDTKRGTYDREIPARVRAHFTVAIDCNGNGACFGYQPDHIMCPSWKGTRDRVHSPKGRAGLMREWLRQLAGAGCDPTVEDTTRPGGWLGRAWRSIRRPYDYSHEVYAAMTGCLSCKACATQCPIKVDVPRFKAEFLELYHGRYLRPLSDLLLARLEGSLPWLARAPRLTNALTSFAPVRWFMRRVAGIVDIPELSHEPASDSLPLADPTSLTHADPTRTVIVVPDAFTTFYASDVLRAVATVARAVGREAYLAPYFPNGKGLHVKGMLRAFRELVARNHAHLEALAVTGVPMIGVDPAVTLTYRDEYPWALGLERAPYRVELLQEWLAEVIEAAPALPADDTPPYVLLGHCTERALVPDTGAQWKRVFAAAGLRLETPAVGCCGMSGVYGHEAKHLDQSRGIYALGWAHHVPDAPQARARILADGYSCRDQLARFADFTPRHPIEVLAERFG